jgi:hypothetical protein
MEKEESDRGGRVVVDGWRVVALLGLGEEKRIVFSDERERGRGNEIELSILILLRGIMVISSI